MSDDVSETPSEGGAGEERAGGEGAEHTAPVLAGHSLYMHHLCYFCAKVEQAISSLGLNLESKNIMQHPEYREELAKGGGSNQVPCLRIDVAGEPQWMYESNTIIAYLTEKGSS
jgi:glutaredoxin